MSAADVRITLEIKGAYFMTKPKEKKKMTMVFRQLRSHTVNVLSGWQQKALPKTIQIPLYTTSFHQTLITAVMCSNLTHLPSHLNQPGRWKCSFFQTSHPPPPLWHTNSRASLCRANGVASLGDRCHLFLSGQILLGPELCQTWWMLRHQSCWLLMPLTFQCRGENGGK